MTILCLPKRAQTSLGYLLQCPVKYRPKSFLAFLELLTRFRIAEIFSLTISATAALISELIFIFLNINIFTTSLIESFSVTAHQVFTRYRRIQGTFYCYFPQNPAKKIKKTDFGHFLEDFPIYRLFESTYQPLPPHIPNIWY